ncbi:DUF3369 domain-containing protein [Alteromonas lipolytica]|uniref:Metal-dependent phosphohydrolase n=1 Tax=Alteromonas lipolytica TaxID=1856405 RepID=A0A1E8FFJ6_9ALTE|nr:DUF3369 domain-containing protein [Alteromonas lipolytica]OFI34690.1 metal-dependent phosphohydrolase [Alteromonas lipolytica]GGF53199.1 hypothetical protein GCM10011338_01670 [Alteromonas lipolytica]
MNDDEFLFAEDDDEVEQTDISFWKVLIVDDEPEVHAITKLALNDFALNGRSLTFISAFNGEEAKRILRENDDIAVVLLDVVMETDDAGLKVADYIRNSLDNHFTRIILRTGQPGQAPEKDIIINYDINDYKSKTELTAQKLFTVIIAALRSYRDIIVIEEARAGLEKIIDASADLFSTRSLEGFMRGLIQQLASILGGAKNAAYITSAVAMSKPVSQSSDMIIFAGNGDYAGKEGFRLKDSLSEFEYELCKEALKQKQVVYAEEHLVAFCRSDRNHGSLLFLTGLPRPVNDIDKRLVQKFTDNVQLAFDHLLESREISDTHQEIVQRLGDALDTRQTDDNHGQRLYEMSELFARLVHLPEPEIQQFLTAIPLHNVGNSFVPYSLLNKETSLTDDEYHQILKHAEFGYKIFKGSKRPVIRLAAQLARHHHERWDGKGYPDGLVGTDISLQSRMLAILDAYDALRNKRSYKPAWPLQKTIDTLSEAAGHHFDPGLVDLFLKHIDQFESVQRKFADQ